MDDLIQNTPFVLLQFGSEKCAPCHSISYKLEQWQLQHGNVVIRYIPIEQFPELPAQLGIYSAPTILTYIDGKLFQRESGYFSLEQLLEQFSKKIEIFNID